MSDKCDAIDEVLRSASNSGAAAMRELVTHVLLRLQVTHNGDPVLAAALMEIRALPAPSAPASPWRDMESAPKTGERILLKVRPRAQFGDETEQVAIGRWFDHNGTKMPWEGWKRGWSTDLAVYSQAFGWMPLPSADLPTSPASKDS